MIGRPTAFVLGAGASVPYGFPAGRALRDTILDRLNWRDQVWKPVLNRLGFQQIDVERLTQGLRGSGLASIDAYLEHHKDQQKLGKTAIALALVPRESPQRLQQDDWYQYVWNRMVTAKLEDLSRNQVSFVTFNYDQSLEVFFLSAIEHTYGVDSLVASEVLREIPLVHVHGVLEHSLGYGEASEQAIGSAIADSAIQSAAAGVQIVSEVEDNSEHFSKAKMLLNEADQICFLGFGYHENNLSRLGVKGEVEKPIVGSCFELRQAERQRISARWAIELEPSGRDLSHLGCLPFLQEAVGLE